jgi:hypothetical protein
MTGQAGRRLIDAAATLDPPDRALLNLWLHRGLGDDRLAALTGMTADAVRRRRERILSDLSAELSLPEQDVADALRALERSPTPDLGSPSHEDVAGDSIAEPATMTTTPIGPPPGVATASDAAEDPVGPAPVDPSPPPAQPPMSRGRGRVWLAIIAAVAVVVAGVLVILLSAGGSARRTDAVTTTSTSTPTAPATTPITGGETAAARTGSTPSTATESASNAASTRSTAVAARSGPRLQALIALPGGLTHASGMARLLGHGQNLKLRLTVKGLPHRRHGHYEAWLYDTVLDSHALGRVRRGATMTYRLPRDARRYAAIDISYQPRGTVTESGESRLRALNPAHYARTATGRHTSRDRHRGRRR